MSGVRVGVIIAAILVVAGGVFLVWWNQPMRRHDRALAECREATEEYGHLIADMEIAAGGIDAEYLNRVARQVREAGDRAEVECAKMEETAPDW